MEEEGSPRDELMNMPLYQKGREILDMTTRILEMVDDESDEEFYPITDIKSRMMLDAANLSVKVAGAIGGGLYDLKMENAAIIRKSARELVTSGHGLVMYAKRPEEFKDYLVLIRELVEEYRVLFAEWVKTFDQWDYIIDRWGLFNPPGVNYDDVDPDDMLPPDDGFFFEE